MSDDCMARTIPRATFWHDLARALMPRVSEGRENPEVPPWPKSGFEVA